MRLVTRVAGVVAVSLLVGACGGDDVGDEVGTGAPDPTEVSVPDREPDLIGTITEITPSESGEVTGTILVEGDLAPDRGRKISYSVTTETAITGADADFAGFAEGQVAETWATGPCAESNPEQCALEAIRVTG